MKISDVEGIDGIPAKPTGLRAKIKGMFGGS